MFKFKYFQSHLLEGQLKFILWSVFIIVICNNVSITNARKLAEIPNEKNCQDIEIDGTMDLTRIEDKINCDTIYGNVIISKINGNSLKNITFTTKDIHGYLLVYHTQNLDTLHDLFPNLVIIRGKKLFNKYSLVIFENIDLKNIGLNNLVRINNGSVRIENNPTLCYVKTINWIEILANVSQQNYVLKKNRDSFFCPVCKKISKDSKELFGYNTRNCWSYDAYQKVCTDCKTKEKCLIDCCTNDSACDGICSNYKVHSDGRCVNSCSEIPGLYEHNSICYGKEICENLGLIPFSSNCLSECPETYEKIHNECEKCNGTCYRECTGQFVIHHLEDAKPLYGCTKVIGSITFELKDKTSKIMNQLRTYLSSIHSITDYLKISKSPQLTTLNLFKNLKIIVGEKLYQNRYSLYVTENDNVEFIWRKNVTIVKGHVYFHMNPKFCIQLLETLTLQNENSDLIASPHSNGISLKGFCDDNFRTQINISVESKNSTAVRLLLDPRWLGYLQKRVLLGYEYYFMETEQNVSIDGIHGCGRDDWKLELDLSMQVRHIIGNLKPNTRYAYYVKTLVILDAPLRKYATSRIQYFRTLAEEPKPITKVYYNFVNDTHLDLFWRPPTDLHTHNATKYIISWGEIDELHSIEMNIKYNGTCVKPKKVEWRGLSPFHKDYYNRDSLDFEFEMPNKIFYLAPMIFPLGNISVIQVPHEVKELNMTDVEAEVEREEEEDLFVIPNRKRISTKDSSEPDFIDPTDDEEEEDGDTIYKSMDSQYYMFNSKNTSWAEFGWLEGPEKYPIILPNKNTSDSTKKLCSDIPLTDRCAITNVPHYRITKFNTDHWIVKVMIKSCDESFVRICSKPIYFELKKPLKNKANKNNFYL